MASGKSCWGLSRRDLTPNPSPATGEGKLNEENLLILSSYRPSALGGEGVMQRMTGEVFEILQSGIIPTPLF